MKRGRRPSLAGVVVVVLVTVTTLVLATSGAFTYFSRQREQSERLRTALAAHADELVVALALPVWNIDRAQIDRIIGALSASPAIEAVTVTAAGRVHALARDAEWRLLP